MPQIVVKAGEKKVNILEAGHRAGDAIVRCSELQKELQDAFKAVLKGNAEPLAKIAPTSLVFGVWDSRDTQAKLPRLVASTIRAFNVRKLTRSAQFNPATEFVNDKLLDEPADKATKDAYAERGFIHVPATGSHWRGYRVWWHPSRCYTRPRRAASALRRRSEEHSGSAPLHPRPCPDGLHRKPSQTTCDKAACSSRTRPNRANL